MKKNIFFLVLYFYSFCALADTSKDNLLHIQSAKQQAKMNVLLGVIGKDSALTHDIAQILNECLSCKNQKKTGFNITIKNFETVRSKKDIRSLFAQGYPLVIFLNNSNRKTLEWRVYDATQAEMVEGKRVKISDNIMDIAYGIADDVWVALTGKQSCFSTRLAFCKESEKNGKKSMSDVYIQHPFFSDQKKELVSSKLPKFAPRWMQGAKNPKLFFSEYTPFNARLAFVTMKGEKNIAVNFDGLNMMPSFSSNGKHVVLCSSCEGRGSHLYYGTQVGGGWQFRRLTEKLTNNKGNNLSPTLCDNGNVIFCSDFKTRRPQIYLYKAAEKKLIQITKDGYCTNPHYSSSYNTIAYSKSINGTLQICLYHIDSEKHEQLTFDKASKDDCSWSPCGSYLAFTNVEENQKRIAVLNVHTKEQFFVTDKHERCAYPSWSPTYSSFTV